MARAVLRMAERGEFTLAGLQAVGQGLREVVDAVREPDVALDASASARRQVGVFEESHAERVVQAQVTAQKRGQSLGSALRRGHQGAPVSVTNGAAGGPRM